MSGNNKRAVLMQGNEAVAEAAIAAGVRFYAGYPISPSSEIPEVCAKRLPQVGGVFVQMEDEIAGLAAALGASLTGKKAMTATSGPGFSLMQENIGYGIMAEIPCVIVNVQRAGPSTGLPTHPAQGDVMQSRWGTHGDHPVITLCPTSVLEAYELTVKAVNFSEKYRTPVILLMDEVVGHMRERVELPDPAELAIEERERPTVSPADYLPFRDTQGGVPPMAPFGTGYRYHVTGLYHDEYGFPSTKPDVVAALIQRLHRKIELGKQEICLTREYMTGDCDILVISYGITARSAYPAVKEARKQGIKAGLLTLNTLWPFPEEAVRAAAGGAGRVIVAELNLGQVRLEVERVLRGQAPVEGLHKTNGELLTPDEILRRLGGNDNAS